MSRTRGVAPELVIITGMSGSGKASVLKAFEDLGYYCVDNLPIALIPRFAEMSSQSVRDPAHGALWSTCGKAQSSTSFPEF